MLLENTPIKFIMGGIRNVFSQGRREGRLLYWRLSEKCKTLIY